MSLVLALASIVPLPFLSAEKTSGLQETSKDILKSLNLLQITNAIIVLAVVWQEREETSWFHLRFLMDTTGFAAWATVFTSLACPGYLTDSILTLLGVIVFFVLSGLVMFQLFIKMHAAAIAGCVADKLYWEYAIGFTIIIGTMGVVFILLGIFNRSPASKLQNHRGLLISLQLCSAGALMLELAYQYIDYNDLKYFLNDTEDSWSFSQKSQVGLVFAAVVVAFWIRLGADSEFYSPFIAASC